MHRIRSVSWRQRLGPIRIASSALLRMGGKTAKDLRRGMDARQGGRLCPLAADGRGRSTRNLLEYFPREGRLGGPCHLCLRIPRAKSGRSCCSTAPHRGRAPVGWRRRCRQFRLAEIRATCSPRRRSYLLCYPPPAACIPCGTRLGVVDTTLSTSHMIRTRWTIFSARRPSVRGFSGMAITGRQPRGGLGQSLSRQCPKLGRIRTRPGPKSTPRCPKSPRMRGSLGGRIPVATLIRANLPRADACSPASLAQIHSETEALVPGILRGLEISACPPQNATTCGRCIRPAVPRGLG